MNQINHRIKLMGGIALICLTIISFLGITLYIASERMELALVEQLVPEEMEFLIQRYTNDPEFQPTNTPKYNYYIIEDNEQVLSLPTEIRTLEQGHHEIFIESAGGQRDVFIRDEGNIRFLVVYDIGPYENREADFRKLILLSVFLSVILAVILGYIISGILTRQLSKLTQQVKNLQPGQPYKSLVNNEQDTEVSILANAIDDYHSYLLSMIKREQDFTANVAHELRTPLTTIRTSCELLETNDNLDDKSIERIHYIIESVDSMTEHAEALLFLARGEKLSANTTLFLRECVEDSLSSHKNEIDSKGLKLEINIPPDETINVNRQAIQLVLNNLLKNAIMYTDKGYICVSYSENTLSIEDSGCGISKEQISKIFERQYRVQNDKPGLGLGLDIVNRICVRCNWQIQVISEQGKGTTFLVSLS